MGLNYLALLLSVSVVFSQEVSSQTVVPPTVVKSVKAAYTKEARDARIEGTVVVEIVVSVDGLPKDVKVIESLDTKYGLDAEAVRASREWRFVPASKEGKPIERAIRVEHSFKLELCQGGIKEYSQHV
jgi:TonB family protein